MLGLAKRVGARFLLTSTSEVYGDPLQHPQAETYWGNVNPIGKTLSLSLTQIPNFVDNLMYVRGIFGMQG
jgi:nucleoside-diphosphate-sugar epimerase